LDGLARRLPAANSARGVDAFHSLARLGCRVLRGGAGLHRHLGLDCDLPDCRRVHLQEVHINGLSRVSQQAIASVWSRTQALHSRGAQAPVSAALRSTFVFPVTYLLLLFYTSYRTHTYTLSLNSR